MPGENRVSYSACRESVELAGNLSGIESLRMHLIRLNVVLNTADRKYRYSVVKGASLVITTFSDYGVDRL